MILILGKFILSRESITKTGSGHKLTIINQINNLNEEVEHDDTVIDAMIHSSKSSFFRPDLEVKCVNAINDYLDIHTHLISENERHTSRDYCHSENVDFNSRKLFGTRSGFAHICFCRFS